ncbi:MAG: adenylate/guanylate cyclase domain-containing protein [Candidatus Lustribacter sp.]
MLSRWHIPIQPYLTALFAIITLVIGLSTAALFYDRMKTASLNDANLAFDQVSTRIAQQLLQVRLEVQYGLALATAGRLANTPSFNARLAAKDGLWLLLNANGLVTAAYVGYPNGDFLLFRKIRAGDRPPPSLRGSAVYLLRTVENRGTGEIARLSFYDRNRKLIAVRVDPKFRFDPRTRPWFRAGTDSVALTQPYLFVSENRQRIGSSMSLRSVAGSVFGVDLDLDSTPDWLAGLLPTPSAVAAAVDAASGVVFVFSDRKILESINRQRAAPATVYDMHSAPLVAAFADAQRRTFPVTHGTYTDLQHRVWLYTVTPAKGANGKALLFPLIRGGKTVFIPRAVLVLAAPEDEVLASAARVRNDVLIVCAALLLAMVPIAYWFSQLISRPLHRLRADALALRSLDFSERPRRNSLITELDEFSDTFGTMRSHIREHNAAVANFIPHQFLELLGHRDVRGLQLGDHCESVMTMLFSDIRAFTTLSGSMTTAETFRFVNSYLTHIGPIVRENGGFIDKYIGDAIFALFPAGPGDAVDAAVAMQRRVVTYNEGRARAGYAPIAIGIGLHRGELMLGTIGESLRFETTVIADAVNIAARMEGLTKAFGALILASGEVMETVERMTYRTRKLGEVLVKGAVRAITVYEVCDADPFDLLEHKMRTNEDFERGRLAYAAGDFKTAERVFRDVAAGDERDQVAAYFRDRAAILASATDVVLWDGVEHMESK